MTAAASELAEGFWRAVSGARVAIRRRDWTRADAIAYALQQLVMLPEATFLQPHLAREGLALRRLIEDQRNASCWPATAAGLGDWGSSVKITNFRLGIDGDVPL